MCVASATGHSGHPGRKAGNKMQKKKYVIQSLKILILIVDLDRLFLTLLSTRRASREEPFKA